MICNWRVKPKTAQMPSNSVLKIMPDVVLMDMVMPDMDGVTATRAIRQQFPQVQVIALTSFKEGN